MNRALSKLYDALVYLPRKAYSALRGLRSRSGEQGMARMLGPYGSGGYGPQQLTRAEQVQHFRGWVYTCVDFICTQISREPPTVVLAAEKDEQADHAVRHKAFRSGKGPRPESRRWCPDHFVRKAQGPAKPHEAYEFLPDDDWLVRLLQNPNDPETGVSVWYEWQMYAELCGSSYLWVVEDGAGRPKELWVIPAHWVKEVCEGDEQLIDYYEVQARGGSAGLVRFSPDEVVRLWKPNPLSKLYGASPVQAAATTIDSYELTEAARVHSLRNGAAVGGTIEMPPDAILDDKQLERLEARFANKFAGVHNFGRPIVLTGGGKYVPAPAEQELAFIQSLDQLRKWVQAHFRLSEAALGFAGDTNRASMVAAIASAMYHVVNPRQSFAAAVLTEKLAKRRDPRARVFWPDCTPSDPDAERSDYQALIQGNAVSVNDLRTWKGLEPFPEEEYDRPQQKTAGPAQGAAGGQGGPMGGQAAGLADDTSMRPADEMKAAAGDLTTKHAATPPRPGLAFNDESHHWERPADEKPQGPDRHPPQPQFGTPVPTAGPDVPPESEDLAALAAACPEEAKQPGLWGQVKEKLGRVREVVYGAMLRITPAIAAVVENVLDTPKDLEKFGFNPTGSTQTTDALHQHTGIGTHLATSIASRVLASAWVWAKKRLATKGHSAADLAAAHEWVKELVEKLNAVFGD